MEGRNLFHISQNDDNRAFKSEKVHVVMNTPEEKKKLKEKKKAEKESHHIVAQLTKTKGKRNPDLKTRFDNGFE